MRNTVLFAAFVAPMIVLSACGSDAATTTVPVTPTVSAATITVQGTVSSIEVGKTAQLSAIARDANGSILSRTFAWASSNTAVATVTNDGMVTGVSAGNAAISATTDGKFGSTTVSVVSPAPIAIASVTISGPQTSLEIGATVQLSATMKDAAGNVLSGRASTWSTSNANVALVDVDGKVTAVSAGATTVTAASEGKNGSLVITILPRTGLDISLSSPIAASRFVVGISGGGLTQTQLINVDATTPTTGRINISLPAGGPYRIRALAMDAAATGESGWSTFLIGASGKSEGVTVTSGSRTATTVNLSRPTITIDAPTQVQGGAAITVSWTYNDPSDVLETDDGLSNRPQGTLEYSTQPFIDRGGRNSVIASATKVSSGVYQFTATWNAPVTGGTIYYQTVTFALFVPFAQGDKLGGVLVTPSSGRGEPLRTIVVQ